MRFFPSRSLLPASTTSVAGAFAAEDLSAQVLAERLARHAEEARGTLAPATEALIRTAARRFGRWCAEHGVMALPASGQTVAAFINAMAEQLKPATVGAYVSCIDHLHRAADLLPPPGSTKPARLALKRMRRSLGTHQKQATPLRWPLIATALERMGSTPLDLRDAALIALAYDTFCRAAEIVALTVGDLEHDGEVASVRIARSKTDQEGEGDYRHVRPLDLCAAAGVAPLRRALRRRPAVPGPLPALHRPAEGHRYPRQPPQGWRRRRGDDAQPARLHRHRVHPPLALPSS